MADAAAADVNQGLAGLARQPLRARAPARRALVVGAGGALGAAVLEHLLAARAFERVGALVDQPIQPALSGFAAVTEDAVPAFAADTALVVFDRARQANGREAAFVRPLPPSLGTWAQRLRAAGATRLVVVVPHAPALLPMALQRGLASLDEAAVAALGFEQLVFMRMAQDARAEGALPAPRRLARWMLSQLRYLVPSSERPVRVHTVAQVAAALAVELGTAPAATRVVPAELLWQAAQQRDVPALVHDWLLPSPHGDHS
jgi:hypothetical protein